MLKWRYSFTQVLLNLNFSFQIYSIHVYCYRLMLQNSIWLNILCSLLLIFTTFNCSYYRKICNSWIFSFFLFYVCSVINKDLYYIHIHLSNNLRVLTILVCRTIWYKHFHSSHPIQNECCPDWLNSNFSNIMWYSVNKLAF